MFAIFAKVKLTVGPEDILPRNVMPEGLQKVLDGDQSLGFRIVSLVALPLCKVSRIDLGRLQRFEALDDLDTEGVQMSAILEWDAPLLFLRSQLGFQVEGHRVQKARGDFSWLCKHMFTHHTEAMFLTLDRLREMLKQPDEMNDILVELRADVIDCTADMDSSFETLEGSDCKVPDRVLRSLPAHTAHPDDQLDTEEPEEPEEPEPEASGAETEDYDSEAEAEFRGRHKTRPKGTGHEDPEETDVYDSESETATENKRTRR